MLRLSSAPLLLLVLKCLCTVEMAADASSVWTGITSLLEFRSRMREGKRDEAWATVYRARALGGFISGHENEESNKVLATRERKICPSKLEHDIQQMDHLLSTVQFNRTSTDELKRRRGHYAEPLGWLEERDDTPDEGAEEHAVGCQALQHLPMRLQNELLASYNSDVLPAQLPRLELPVLRKRIGGWGSVESDFWNKGYAVIDDLLTDKHYEHLLRFTAESSAFTRVDFPFIGAYLPRLATPLLENLSAELPHNMPEVFRGSPLQMLWIYKHVPPRRRLSVNETAPAWKLPYGQDGQPQKGSSTHNDMATVNVNLMISSEGAKLKGGGLQVIQSPTTNYIRHPHAYVLIQPQPQP